MIRRDPSNIDDDNNGDDDENIEMESLNQFKISQLNEQEKFRYELFKSKSCDIPLSHLKELMSNATNRNLRVADNARIIVSKVAKLFAGQLIEKARSLQGNNQPLTPDMIMIAFSDLEAHGKIPGRGPQHQLSEYH